MKNYLVALFRKLRDRQVNGRSLVLRKYFVSLICFVAFTLITSVLAKANHIAFYSLLSDPNEIAEQPPYFGFFSTIGIFLWCGTSAICLFSALVVFQTSISSRKIQLFLLFSGLLIAQLLVDDTFQIHEYFSTLLYGMSIEDIPRNAQNLAEGLVISVYAIESFGLIFIFREVILQSDLLFALIAISCLTVSVILDMAPDAMNWLHVLEEYFKLFGIFSVFIYYLEFCEHQFINNIDLNRSFKSDLS